jgi:hypothetical protein
MTEDNEIIPDVENENEDEKANKLPYCTTASTAEHLRGENDDEPCDDGRAGD